MSLPASKHETSLWPRLPAPVLLGFLALGLQMVPASAAPVSTYVVSDQDGYGVMECLAQKSDCGKVVADAWCESHGHGPARAYGPSDDVTAAIPVSGSSQPIPAGATIIACAE
jgi:hypothetical protein